MISEFSRMIGFSVDEILGESRKQEIVAARQLYWKVLRDAGFTFEEIASLCGMSHATVIHGVRVATERIEIADSITMGVWNKVREIAYDYSSGF